MSKICGNCNYSNEDTAVFCVNCGAELTSGGTVCPQCGADISPADEHCPNCGAVNGNYKRTKDLTPRTIMELQQWYAARSLPSEETTRFFIGRNYKGAKAFGIYRDSNGDFVVYKNKADGSRAVRYRGKDEAFAVNEIYTKLRETIQQQKSNPVNRNRASSASSSSSSSKGNRNKGCLSKPLVIFIIAVLAIVLFKGLVSGRCSIACDGCYACISCIDCGTGKGYYTGEGSTWYYDHGTWFLYNALLDSWSRSSSGPGNYSSYDFSYSSPSGVTDATGSTAYSDASSSWSNSSSSGWDDFWSGDSDYDWDSGSSWDYDWGGGWDSDW